MATIRSTIELFDAFSAPLERIMSAVDSCVSATGRMQTAMNANIDTSPLQAVEAQINGATGAAQEFEAALNNVSSPSGLSLPKFDTAVVEIPVTPVVTDQPEINTPDEITIPVTPVVTDKINLDVPALEVPVFEDLPKFDAGESVVNYQAQISGLSASLQRITNTQNRINAQANAMNVLPKETAREISAVNRKIEEMTAQLSYIQQNAHNFDAGTIQLQIDAINKEIQQATESQAALNAAVDNMDGHIADNENEQEKFNRAIQQGTESAFSLQNMIAGAVGIYATLSGLSSVLDVSDTLAQTTSRLNIMNDGLQSTQDLMKMVYQSAQNSRGSFQGMADVVARFGNNAKDAFSSSAEVVAFSELVQKQMTIAGASTAEASNAMLQLSQALGSGVLRGDELNSIFEQAPNLIRNIADYLNVPLGTIRQMAQEGELTADVVKAAIFAATDDINAKFAAMPMTWGQVWQRMENAALMAFQPIADRLSALANNTTLINFAIVGINAVVAVIAEIFDLVAAVGAFIAEYWSLIAPVVGGATAALVGFVAVLTVYNAIQTITAAKIAAIAFEETARAAAAMMATGATFAETAAQYGLNAALYACPITWIVVAVIALVAALYAAVAAVNRFAGTSISATGIIAAAFMVMYATIQNGVIVPLWNGFAMLANFIGNVFNSPIAAVEVAFYDMCLTVIGYIQNLASAIETLLNKIPGVTVDITSGLDNFYNGLAQAQQAVKDESGWVEYVGKMDYTDLGDAAEQGYEFGEGLADAVENFDPNSLFGVSEFPSAADYAAAMAGDAGLGDDLGGDVGDVAGNTGSIANELSDTDENLKYLRDVAEQEAINRFTTAEIKVDMSGMQNTVNSNMDLDGMVSYLTDALTEQMSVVAEGVHT